MERLACFTFAVLLIGAYGQDVPTTTNLPNTTVTAAPTTTEPPTTTPTEAPTTTSAPAPPTPAPTPAHDEFFRVTENNVTCVMYGGDVKFSITYKQDSGKLATTTVSVPQPSADYDDVKSSGSCNTTMDGGEQYIKVIWGPTNERSSFALLFNSTGSKWMLVHSELNLYLNEKNFTNATDAGKFLNVVGEFPGLSNVAVDTNSSLSCRAAIDSKNFTSQVMNSTLAYPVTASAVGVKLQAFNSVPFVTDMQQGIRCEADVTSDLVPIAVGCALAGLVLLVLISYLVGRRRRSAAYQSV